jgi:hypothetical protein
MKSRNSQGPNGEGSFIRFDLDQFVAADSTYLFASSRAVVEVLAVT